MFFNGNNGAESSGEESDEEYMTDEPSADDVCQDLIDQEEKSEEAQTEQERVVRRNNLLDTIHDNIADYEAGDSYYDGSLQYLNARPIIANAYNDRHPNVDPDAVNRVKI